MAIPIVPVEWRFASLMPCLLALAASCFAAPVLAQSPSTAWFPNKHVRALAISDGLAYIGGDFDHVGPPTGSFAQVGGGLPATALLGNVGAVVSDGAGGWYVGGEALLADGSNLVHLRSDGKPSAVALPQPDGRVEALLMVGATLYVGGEFQRIGTVARARAAAVDTATGRVQDWAPDIRSTDSTPRVHDLAHVAGDILIAGQFNQVGGQAIRHLTLVDADHGVPRSWNAALPDTAGVIAVLAQGNRILLGGAFDSVAGQARSNLAAVDATSGVLLPWAPRADGYVRALASDGTAVWVGGSFEQLEGQFRRGVGALDASSGALLPFDAKLSTNSVEALAVRGNTVWIGGGFVAVRGLTQQRIAAVNAQTGLIQGTQVHASAAVSVFATDTGGRLMAGGRFASLGGVPRGRGAAIDLATGRPTAWDPGADGSVLSLAIRDGRVYAAGCFGRIGGAVNRFYVAELEAATAAATAWQPQLPDSTCVNAIAVTSQDVYIGGRWNTIGSRRQAGLARLSRSTGALTGNNLSTGGNSEVLALALDETGHRLYVAGAFSRLAGARRVALGELDLASGLPTGFDARISSGWVEAVARSGNTLYFGGVFDKVRGKPRANIAAASLDDGSLLPWLPQSDDGSTAGWRPASILVRPEAVYIGGSPVGDAQTSGLVTAVHPISGVRLPWSLALRSGNGQQDSDSRVRVIGGVDGDTLAIGGAGMRFDGTPRVDFGIVQRAGLE